ncbi:MAG: glycosyltransferase family 4 protein [Polyangiaceae bacterium]|nr:glycosyltransferase family 4 protein [Polyangiaceae bacterium]
MRVLYLTPGCFDKGGISRYSRYQIRALRELFGEHSVTVLSLLGPTGESFEDPFAVDWHGSGANQASKVGLVTRTLAFAAARKPQLVHSAHVNFSALAYSAARMVEATACVNVYGLEVWSGLSGDAEWGLRHSDLVVADCHFTANYLLEARLRCVAPTVVWDCVDLGRFSPGPPSPAVLQRYGIPDPRSGWNLLTLGRMSSDADHKGYTRLYEAFRRIAPDNPRIRVVFAGRGQLAETLRERARRDGLGSQVCFTGMVHDDDLADVYRAAHAFSLVSDRGIDRGEGIPLTPLEAAACGLPLIVGDHDGSQEAVVHGINGFVIDPFDLDAHSQRILELANAPDLRARMAREARKRIEDEFDYVTFREKHRRLLERWFPEPV